MRRKRSLHRIMVRGSIRKLREGSNLLKLGQTHYQLQYEKQDRFKKNDQTRLLPLLSTQGFSTFGRRGVCGDSWGQICCQFRCPLPAIS